MPNSMTGYSEALVKKKDINITVSLKSLNHRFFELSSFKSPEKLRYLEKDTLALLKSAFSRGRFDVSFFVNVPESANRALSVDWKRAENYFEFLKKLKNKYKIKGDIVISDIISGTELFIKTDEKELKAGIAADALKALKSAIDKLQKSRLKEGAYLAKDIKGRMKEVRNKISLISKLSLSMPCDYAEKMRKRLSKINSENGVNEEKVAELVAITADKCDISEELSRLTIHLQNFGEIIDSKGECGRKLEFYLQEIHREINTVGSKAIKPEITDQVVQIKSELEKVREQVQNIE